MARKKAKTKAIKKIEKAVRKAVRKGVAEEEVEQVVSQVIDEGPKLGVSPSKRGGKKPARVKVPALKSKSLRAARRADDAE